MDGGVGCLSARGGREGWRMHTPHGDVLRRIYWDEMHLNLSFVAYVCAAKGFGAHSRSYPVSLCMLNVQKRRTWVSPGDGKVYTRLQQYVYARLLQYYSDLLYCFHLQV